MSRTSKILSAIALAIPCFWALSWYATETHHHADRRLAGGHYRLLELEKEAAFKEDVVVFFWYGCPHCSDALGAIRESPLTKDLTLKVIHSQISADWIADADIFFGASRLGAPQGFHEDYARHRRGLGWRHRHEIEEIAGRYDLALDKIIRASETDSALLERKAMVRIEIGLKLRSVPAVIVRSKYLINPGSLRGSGGWNALPDVIDQIIRRDDAAHYDHQR